MSLTNVNLVLFGKGNVGATLINQIIEQQKNNKNPFQLRIIGIADVDKAWIKFDGIDNNWESDFEKFAKPIEIDAFIQKIKTHTVENLVAVDITASEEIINYYNYLVQTGFHLVVANKKANSASLDFYQKLRTNLKTYNKYFYYETNVGAGLPIIHPLKNLVNSGERITKINGVFSGTLSYIFNRFAEQDVPFSEIVSQAKRIGLTEPNPIEDLQGTDVARKLLILAREVGLKTELNQVKIQPFLPFDITEKDLHKIDKDLNDRKLGQEEGYVLKYVAELDVEKEKLTVGLQPVLRNSPIGQLKGADNIVQFFSENYSEHPIVIQGAGAGKEVTARGVLGDIIRVSNRLKFNDLENTQAFYKEKIA